MRYQVIVAPSYDFSSAQVAGRIFVKSEAIELGEHELNDEIRNSPVLVVTPIADTPIAPAEQPGIDEPVENSGAPIEPKPFELVDSEPSDTSGTIISRNARKKRGG